MAVKAADIGTKIFSVRLTCGIAAVMLLLSGVIVIDAARRWYVLLSSGATQAETNLPAVGLD